DPASPGVPERPVDNDTGETGDQRGRGGAGPTGAWRAQPRLRLVRVIIGHDRLCEDEAGCTATSLLVPLSGHTRWPAPSSWRGPPPRLPPTPPHPDPRAGLAETGRRLPARVAAEGSLSPRADWTPPRKTVSPATPVPRLAPVLHSLPEQRRC